MKEEKETSFAGKKKKGTSACKTGAVHSHSQPLKEERCPFESKEKPLGLWTLAKCLIMQSKESKNVEVLDGSGTFSRGLKNLRRNDGFIDLSSQNAHCCGYLYTV